MLYKRRLISWYYIAMKQIVNIISTRFWQYKNWIDRCIPINLVIIPHLARVEAISSLHQLMVLIKDTNTICIEQ